MTLVSESSVMASWGIGRVVAVGNAVTKVKQGDLIYGSLGWAEYHEAKEGPFINVLKCV